MKDYHGRTMTVIEINNGKEKEYALINVTLDELHVELLDFVRLTDSDMIEHSIMQHLEIIYRHDLVWAKEDMLITGVHVDLALTFLDEYKTVQFTRKTAVRNSQDVVTRNVRWAN